MKITGIGVTKVYADLNCVEHPQQKAAIVFLVGYDNGEGEKGSRAVPQCFNCVQNLAEGMEVLTRVPPDVVTIQMQQEHDDGNE